MNGMSDVERLIAIAEIHRLKARRDRALDTKDWVTYEALHAPDHISHHGDGIDGGRVGSAADVVRQLSASLVDVATAHHSHTPDITFETPTKANCIWAMEDNLYWTQGREDHWMHGYGFYHETCEKRYGVWLFTFRSLKRTYVMTSPGAKIGADRVAAREKSA
jgi:hypothetical protein